MPAAPNQPDMPETTETSNPPTGEHSPDGPEETWPIWFTTQHGKANNDLPPLPPHRNRHEWHTQDSEGTTQFTDIALCGCPYYLEPSGMDEFAADTSRNTGEQ